MLANDAPINVPARSVEPYLHADNRGLVVFDGRRCVVLPAQTLPWVAETVGILLEEKRAIAAGGPEDGELHRLAFCSRERGWLSIRGCHMQ